MSENDCYENFLQKYRATCQLDRIFQNMLDAMRPIADGWFDFDDYCDKCINIGVAETRIPNKQERKTDIYHHLANDTRSNTVAPNDDNLTEKEIMRLSFEGRICQIFFLKKQCEKLIENQEFSKVLDLGFFFGEICGGYKIMKYNADKLCLDEKAAPIGWLNDIENLAKCRKSGARGSQKAHGAKQKLYAEAVALADELWQEPEHKDKLHHQMAEYILEYSPDNSTVPYSNLKSASLMKKLKEHLIKTERTEKIFNFRGSEKNNPPF